MLGDLEADDRPAGGGEVTAQLWRLTAGALVDGFRRGAFTPEEALAACLERSDACASLNALVCVDHDGALAAARASGERWRAGAPLGPIDGVPVTIKDNLLVRGLPAVWGSRALRALVAQHDELPVARLRDAGAVIFGKTNVPEFTMQGYTDNEVFGPTGNPWNRALTPGGSSGGAVALVAAGGCPLALGTDGGGSIRRPASHTGLVGFKPSPGRIPRAGGLPQIFLDVEVVGPIARCVDDVRRMLEAIGAPDARDPASLRFAGKPATEAAVAAEGRPLRILYVPTFATHPVAPAIAALTADAARALAGLGHQVETAGHFDLVEAVNAQWPLLAQAGLAWLVEHPAALPDGGAGGFDPALFGEAMRAALASGHGADARTLFGLLYEVQRLSSRVSELFERYDALLTPAAAALPWPSTESHPSRIDGHPVGPRGHAIFTAFANAAGLPAIAVPCGFTDGLPVGIQLVMRAGDDLRLLALAQQFEAASTWRDAVPVDPR